MTFAAAADVVCLGEALVDLFPAEPDARGKRLRDVSRFERHAGGAPANTATGFARLGVRVALCTALAEDEFGRFLHQSLEREGVQVFARWVAGASTGLAWVYWDEKGDRRFMFYRRPGADERLDAALVDEAGAALRGARFLHLCTNTLIREPSRGAHRRAMQIAAEAGVPLLVDLNLRVHLWPTPDEAAAAAREMAGAATVLKADGGEARALTGEADPVAAARALVDAARGPVRFACVTLGEEGAAWARRGGGYGHVPAPPVEVVDTTGAGDAFTAALGAGLLRAGAGPEPASAAQAEAVVRDAVRAGTASVGHVGAVAGMLRAHELFRDEAT